MSPITIRPLDDNDREWLPQFFIEYWGSDRKTLPAASTATPPIWFRLTEAPGRFSGSQTPAKVETVHFQGDRLICQLRLGAETIQVSAGARERIAPNAAVWVTVPPPLIHLFDRESGARLGVPGANATETVARRM